MSVKEFPPEKQLSTGSTSAGTPLFRFPNIFLLLQKTGIFFQFMSNGQGKAEEPTEPPVRPSFYVLWETGLFVPITTVEMHQTYCPLALALLETNTQRKY